MAEQAKTPTQIESDAEAAKYPNATEVEITLTRGPKKEVPDFIPPPVSDSRRYTDDPSMITAAPETALGGGLAEDTSLAASPALQIEDDIGLMDEPVGAMVFEDDIDLFDFQGEKHDKMEIAGHDGTPIIIKKTEPESDYAKALKYGFDKSTIGILLNKEVPDYREQVFSEEVVSALGEFFGDIPPILLGGAAGIPSGPIGMVAGGYAMTSGFKKHLMDSIEKGKLNVDLTAPEFWERMTDVVEETGKGYVTGAVAGYAGQTAKMATELAQASKFTKAIAQYAAITEGMVLTGSTLEGHIPTGKDHAVAGAAAVLMSKTAQVPGALAKAVKKSQEKWSNEGKHPLKLKLEEIIDSPILEPLKGERGAVGKEREPGPGEIDDLFFKKNRLNPEKERSVKMHESFEKADAKQERLDEMSLKKLNEIARKYIWDRAGKMKEVLKEVYGEAAEPFIKLYNLSFGWGKHVKLILEKANKEISGGLTRKEIKYLNRIIEAWRGIEVTKNRREFIQRYSDEIKKKEEDKSRKEERFNKFHNEKTNILKEKIAKLELDKKPLEERKAYMDQLKKEKRIWDKEPSLKKSEIAELSKIKNEIYTLEKEIRKYDRQLKSQFRDEIKPLEEKILNLKNEKNTINKITNPDNKTLEDYQSWLDDIDPKTKTKLYPKAEIYNRVMREMLEDLYKNGLLDREAFEAIAKRGEHYSPRLFDVHKIIEGFDPEDVVATTRSGKKVMSSGLKHLEDGSVAPLLKDHRKLLEVVVKRTQARIFNNRAATALYELASEGKPKPKKAYMDILQVPSEDITSIPPHHVELTAMVKGRKKKFWMRQDIGKEFLDESGMSPEVAQFLRYISGSNILKISATGANPEFMVTNFPRDTFLTTFASDHFSHHWPVALLKYAVDLPKATMDVFLKREAYQEKAAVGGFQDMWTAEGLGDMGFTARTTEGKLSKTLEWLSKPGQWVEEIPRMALYSRARKNGLSPIDAAAEAREILDFRQGGIGIKGLENINPYINAAVVGTRTTLRYIRNNPGKALYKIGTLGTFVAALYEINHLDEDMTKAYNRIPLQTRVKFFIFMIPWHRRKDKETKEWRYPYITIAKDQGQQIIATVFESLAAKLSGNKISPDEFKEALKNAVPQILSLPPTANAREALKNWNTYFEDNIWKGPDVAPSEEYNKNTNPASILIGQMLGISPMRLESAISSIWASSNPLYALTGLGFSQILEELPEREQRQIFDKWNSYIFIRRLVRWTGTDDPVRRKEMKDIVREENTIKIKHNKGLERVFNKYREDDIARYEKSEDYIDEVTNYFGNNPQDIENKRLRRRLKMMDEISDLGEIPDKNFWFLLGEISDPVTQARFFFEEWKKLKTEKMKERYEDLIIDLKVVPENRRNDFEDKLDELIDAEKGEKQ